MTYRTPARSLSANEIIAPCVVQYAWSAKTAGASRTRPSSRNFRAYVRRDMSAAGAASGFMYRP